MRGSRFVRPVNLPEAEPAGVLGMLQQIETGDPWLLSTALCIFNGGRAKCLDTFGLYPDIYVEDQHTQL